MNILHNPKASLLLKPCVLDSQFKARNEISNKLSNLGHGNNFQSEGADSTHEWYLGGNCKVLQCICCHDGVLENVANCGRAVGGIVSVCRYLGAGFHSRVMYIHPYNLAILDTVHAGAPSGIFSIEETRAQNVR